MKSQESGKSVSARLASLSYLDHNQMEGEEVERTKNHTSTPALRNCLAFGRKAVTRGEPLA
jgi:hypothetical protein